MLELLWQTAPRRSGAPSSALRHGTRLKFYHATLTGVAVLMKRTDTRNRSTWERSQPIPAPATPLPESRRSGTSASAAGDPPGAPLLPYGRVCCRARLTGQRSAFVLHWCVCGRPVGCIGADLTQAVLNRLSYFVGLLQRDESRIAVDTYPLCSRQSVDEPVAELTGETAVPRRPHNSAWVMKVGQPRRRVDQLIALDPASEAIDVSANRSAPQRRVYPISCRGAWPW